jgi:hypothetical protein
MEAMVVAAQLALKIRANFALLSESLSGTVAAWGPEFYSGEQDVPTALLASRGPVTAIAGGFNHSLALHGARGMV